MIIRSLLRRPSALQCLTKAPAKQFFPPAAVRASHNRPTLNNHNNLVENGIPGLFTKEAFKVAYLEYQQLMMDELKACTAGTVAENKEPKALVIDWARDPVKAHDFNIASMAYNNHFFFLGINTDPNITSSPSIDLTYAINENFSSLASLRSEFIATANAMFGPGFVWLVQENDGAMGPGSLRILSTYLAGSPLSGAHYRRQSHDLNTHNPDSFQKLNNVGAFGKNSANQPDVRKQKPLGGVDVSPLLCVNTWEHVWLPDYGIRGKEDFLEKWWDKINWTEVESKARLMPANAGSIKGRNQFMKRSS